MYGTPKNSADIFARFGIVGERVTPTIPINPSVVDVGNIGENNTSQKLKQLTTKPVAGAVFTEAGIRYVEQGTGHVYEINLITGSEALISGTTLPETAEAIFSNNSLYVAITSYNTLGNKTIVGEITDDGSVTGVVLPSGATDVSFADATNTLFYRVEGQDYSTGYSYDIIQARGTEIFKIPLRDVHVLWSSPLYVYTTPSFAQKGYLYQVSQNELMYTTPGGTGLMGVSYDDGVVVTKVSETNVSSFALTHSGVATALPLPLISEKCTQNHARRNALYCTTPTDINAGTFPDDWYKGTLSYSDILWDIDVAGGSATALSNFLLESGREIDVSKIGTNETGAYIYFINKNDNTLWMFDTTP